MKAGIPTAKASCGIFSLVRFTDFEALLAAMRSSNSSPTSETPPILLKHKTGIKRKPRAVVAAKGAVAAAIAKD
ncbi:hypothetical protein L484_001768 [Morus notabilis]|uniref:Uncharacterized protein n=1 Tax=Morus notabilis TaxID=981085 RepID=W9QVZ1_9ROSA|nr:hypothetical protein L484_001768 [Morus notabilis]